MTSKSALEPTPARAARKRAAGGTAAVGERTRWPLLAGPRPCQGLLFIGDPHVWSRRPGRRRDTNYMDTILGKLDWIAQEANARDLWPVILGDLLHEANDSSLVLISRLMAVLQRFDRVPLTMVGNHDLIETTLTEGTVLHVLATAGVINAMTQNAPHALIDIARPDGSTARVLIGGTPYGQVVPVSLAPWVKGVGPTTDHPVLQHALGVDNAVWLTHEDLAFDSSYPNAMELHPILGVDLAVNGHMHRAQKPVPTGATVWHNPGNINRLTIDLIDQTPRVWWWQPGDETRAVAADGTQVPALHPLDIPHVPGPHILSLEGTIAAAHADQAALLADEGPADDAPEAAQAASQFVELMRSDTHVARSDDGVFLRASVDEEIVQRQAPAPVARIVRRLLDKALNQHNNAS